MKINNLFDPLKLLREIFLIIIGKDSNGFDKTVLESCKQNRKCYKDHQKEELEAKRDVYTSYVTELGTLKGRRQNINFWYNSFNVILFTVIVIPSQIVAEITGNTDIGRALVALAKIASPAAGIVLSIITFLALLIYREKRNAMYAVVEIMETELPFTPHTVEKKLIDNGVGLTKYLRSVAKLELFIPVIFGILYFAIILVIVIA